MQRKIKDSIFRYIFKDPSRRTLILIIVYLCPSLGVQRLHYWTAKILKRFIYRYKWQRNFRGRNKGIGFKIVCYKHSKE